MGFSLGPVLSRCGAHLLSTRGGIAGGFLVHGEERDPLMGRRAVDLVFNGIHDDVALRRFELVGRVDQHDAVALENAGGTRRLRIDFRRDIRRPPQDQCGGREKDQRQENAHTDLLLPETLRERAHGFFPSGGGAR